MTENTIASFKDAVAASTDVIEFDVWLTLDDVIVVFHDKTFERMTAGSCDSTVTSCRYDEIPPLVPVPGQRDRCSNFNEADCYRVPTFEHVLDVLPSTMLINIEVKQDSDLLIDNINQILMERNRVQYTYCFSLDKKINNKIRNKIQNITTITSKADILEIALLYWIGMLPFCVIRHDVYGFSFQEVHHSLHFY